MDSLRIAMRRKPRVVGTALVALLFSFASSGCDGEFVAGPDGVSVVEVAPHSHTFTHPDETLQLAARTLDASGAVVEGVTLEWSSSNREIAVVNSKGMVTARSAGTALIVVSAMCCAVADTVALTVQGGLRAGTATATAGDTQVALSATAPSGGEMPYHYQWHRSTSRGFTPASGNALAGLTSRIATDHGVINGTTYYYRLVVKDENGQSAFYDELSATPNGTSKSAPPGTSSGPYPNEPTGFSQLAHQPFDVLLPDGWKYLTAQVANGYRLATDPDRGNVGAIFFPKGMVGGSPPAGLLSPQLNPGPSDLYFHFWFKVTSNWDGHIAGSKIGYVINDGHNGIYFNVAGGGSNPLGFHILVQGASSWRFTAGGGTNGRQNEVTATFADGQIVRGRWHRIEVRLEMGTPGNPDGVVHAWMDGKKIMQYSGITLVAPGDDSNVDHVKWSPIYGGKNAGTPETTVDNDQFQYMDDFYISGAN